MLHSTPALESIGGAFSVWERNASEDRLRADRQLIREIDDFIQENLENKTMSPPAAIADRNSEQFVSESDQFVSEPRQESEETPPPGPVSEGEGEGEGSVEETPTAGPASPESEMSTRFLIPARREGQLRSRRLTRLRIGADPRQRLAAADGLAQDLEEESNPSRETIAIVPSRDVGSESLAQAAVQEAGRQGSTTPSSSLRGSSPGRRDRERSQTETFVTSNHFNLLSDDAQAQEQIFTGEQQSVPPASPSSPELEASRPPVHVIPWLPDEGGESSVSSGRTAMASSSSTAFSSIPTDHLTGSTTTSSAGPGSGAGGYGSFRGSSTNTGSVNPAAMRQQQHHTQLSSPHPSQGPSTSSAQIPTNGIGAALPSTANLMNSTGSLGGNTGPSSGSGAMGQTGAGGPGGGGLSNASSGPSSVAGSSAAGGPGAGAGLNTYPMPPGQQMDLNFLWQQVQELSSVLAHNRESTQGIIRRVGELQRRASTDTQNTGPAAATAGSATENGEADDSQDVAGTGLSMGEVLRAINGDEILGRSIFR